LIASVLALQPILQVGQQGKSRGASVLDEAALMFLAISASWSATHLIATDTICT
jgi:hypothetical protein